MATQANTELLKMAPMWHRVRTLGAPEKRQDVSTVKSRGPTGATKISHSKRYQDGQDSTKMAYCSHIGDTHMRSIWLKIETQGFEICANLRGEVLEAGGEEEEGEEGRKWKES